MSCVQANIIFRGLSVLSFFGGATNSFLTGNTRRKKLNASVFDICSFSLSGVNHSHAHVFLQPIKQKTHTKKPSTFVDACRATLYYRDFPKVVSQI